MTDKRGVILFVNLPEKGKVKSRRDEEVAVVSRCVKWFTASKVVLWHEEQATLVWLECRPEYWLLN